MSLINFSDNKSNVVTNNRSSKNGTHRSSNNNQHTSDIMSTSAVMYIQEIDKNYKIIEHRVGGNCMVYAMFLKGGQESECNSLETPFAFY